MLKLLYWVTSNLTNFYLFIFSLKIFVPITVVALLILIPVNVSSGTLFFLKRELVVSDIDKLSISNVPSESIRYVFPKLPPKIKQIIQNFLYEVMLRLKSKFCVFSS